MTKPTQPPTVTATTKVRLTFRGQSFDMDMAELEDLHERIGKVVEAQKPKVDLIEWAKLLHKSDPEPRPWPYPQPIWLVEPQKVNPPYEITCSWDADCRTMANITVSSDSCDMQNAGYSR